MKIYRKRKFENFTLKKQKIKSTKKQKNNNENCKSYKYKEKFLKIIVQNCIFKCGAQAKVQKCNCRSIEH